MWRRHFYFPVSGLSVIIVIILWIGLINLHGNLENDFYGFSFFTLFAGYLIYFNYPSIQDSLKGLYLSLKDMLKHKKSGNDTKDSARLEEDRLADKYLGDRNSVEHIYEFLKHTRFISDHFVYRILTLVYAAAVTLLVVLLYTFSPPSPEKPADSLQELFYASILVSGLIAYTSIPRFLTTKWRDYSYYLAKAYFALSETDTEVSIKFRYLVEGMEAYNLFLQRNLKIKIKDLQSFYTLISSDKITVQDEIITSLCTAFHQDKNNHDKLEPLRSINNTMNTYYKKELTTGISKKRTLQDWLPVTGLIISSAIAIIQIFVK